MSWYDWLLGPLSLAGTAFGAYSNYENQKQQQRAYEDALRQQALYNAQIDNYYRSFGGYQNNLLNSTMGMIGSLMGAANSQLGGAQQRLQGLMGAPIDPMPYYNQFYKPLTDAEMNALRRGITSQQALRTNGNEGMHIDLLVGQGINQRESAISQAALDKAVQTALGQRQGDIGLAQADVNLAGQYFNFLPAMLSGLSRGFVPPPEPIRPYQVQPPVFPTYPTNAFGDFVKFAAGQDEKKSTQQASIPGQTLFPINYFYGEPTLYGYDPFQFGT